jgi:hypothetical protein
VGLDGQCPMILHSLALNLEQTKCILSTPTDCGHFPYFPHANSLQGGIYLEDGRKIFVLFLLATRLHIDLCQCIAENRKILCCLMLSHVESNDGTITYDAF